MKVMRQVLLLSRNESNIKITIVFICFKKGTAMCFGYVCWVGVGLKQIQETNVIAGEVVLNQYFVFASYTLIISEGLYGMFIRDNFKMK